MSNLRSLPPEYLLGARAHERPLNKAAFAFSRERSLIIRQDSLVTFGLLRGLAPN
jgi:hypothetical protein